MRATAPASSVINTLTGIALATQGTLADDRGRHTTTGRALHRLPAGGWLLDTPGMRELQLTDVKAGLDELFADLQAWPQTVASPTAGMRASLGARSAPRSRTARWIRAAWRAIARLPPRKHATARASRNAWSASGRSARW